MAKKIMIQGTMSNAGKSFLVAGLCRIFKQDGYKVAPFKSQNMALNSFITEEGLEMGRAQVMQAEASGVKPSVKMNPILLKPTTDMGSQVIVNGEVRGNMEASEYFQYKHNLIPDIKKALSELEEEYDIIVIEGAGSPAEINLKENDIVNMGMAKIADAPVLLAGDIDRGGVFAQLAGTVLLLEEEERERIKGVIINKFRGDKKILEPGLIMLEEKIHKPVLGVVHYMQVDIEDEDSLSERLTGKKEKNLIDIAVICLPRISNFTDFNALDAIEEVSVRYVKKVEELGEPDLIILPGTKSTMADLLWLRQNGLEAGIKKAQQKGTLIFGICGGYQMLGKELKDPDGVEGKGDLEGIGLLPLTTVFESKKVRTRVRGHFARLEGEYEILSNVPIEGYEIHMGVTTMDKSVTNLTQIKSFLSDEEMEKSDGAVYKNVAGSYVHGIFDNEKVRNALLNLLLQRKGLKGRENSVVSFEEYKEMQYDKLADEVRKNINMNKIYEIMGIKQEEIPANKK